MDQSGRYADLSLKEEDLIAGDNHMLVAYTMTPMPGFTNCSWLCTHSLLKMPVIRTMNRVFATALPCSHTPV